MPRIDRRRIVGNPIHALAKHVTSDAECKRLFGSFWSKKLVNGVVLDACNGRRAGSNRANWIINGKYFIQGREKVRELNIQSVKDGNICRVIGSSSESDDASDVIANRKNAGESEGPGAVHREAVRIPRAGDFGRESSRHQAEGPGQVQVSGENNFS